MAGRGGRGDSGESSARRSGRFRYGSWHGGPDPLQAPVDIRAAVDELGEKVLAGGNISDALREMLRRGLDGRRGLDELRRRMAKRRRELERRGDLAGQMTQVRAALDQAIATEREELAGRDDDDARFAEMALDDVPDDTASAMRQLDDYAWQSDEARQQFEQIKAQLREQMLRAQFGAPPEQQGQQGQQGEGGQGQQGAPDAAAMEAVREMLTDLNSLLSAHAAGEDTTEQFAEFMDKHGDFFPEQPRDTDDLLDLLARRQAAAERMLRSMTSDQRRQLMDMMQQAMEDAGLSEQMGQLKDNLRSLRPGMMRGQGRADVSGDEPLGYADAAGVVGDLADLEALENQLGQDYPGATLDDVDVEALERQLAPSDVRDLQALRDLERELERQGYVQRDSGELSLTPKALRRLGESALRRIFANLDAEDRGRHDDRRTGAADERTGAYLKWEFGDERPIDAVRTVQNAVMRTATAGTDNSDADGNGLRLVADDFAVAETERRSGAAVALCVDLSFSMIVEERWGPMKQTALALAHLIETRFRTDKLQIIGFNRLAMPLTATELAGIEPEWIQGTNLQHALMLAGRHLRRHPNSEPVVLVVTDGEPTAHLVEYGPGELDAEFNWPSTPETIRATVAEVDAVARLGATLNVFRLGDDPGLARFVDAVARRCGGRVFAPDPSHLGEYVVSDYLDARAGGRTGRRTGRRTA